MYWRTSFASLLLTLLGGCAANSTSPTVSDDHPASPTAMATPMPARSTTLAIVESADRSNASPGQTVDHSAHVHGGPAADLSAPSSTQPGQAVYVCPMHPEVISTKADDRCPKCKMKLKAKPTTQQAAPATAPATSPAGHQHGGH